MHFISMWWYCVLKINIFNWWHCIYFPWNYISLITISFHLLCAYWPSISSPTLLTEYIFRFSGQLILHEIKCFSQTFFLLWDSVRHSIWFSLAIPASSALAGQRNLTLTSLGGGQAEVKATIQISGAGDDQWVQSVEGAESDFHLQPHLFLLKTWIFKNRSQLLK